jgi:hypothetical protein
MKKSFAAPCLLTLAFLATPGWSQTPAAGIDPASSPTRAQVKMDRDEFLKTHRWDEPTETWMLKVGVEPPVGVKSRAEVKLARDRFLANNRWDQMAGGWVPIKEGPRELSTLSRATVRADTAQFMKTHRWDEALEQWVDKPASRPIAAKKG